MQGEMLAGPKRNENEEYMRILKDGGVLASEMETSILFTLGQLYSQQFIKEGGSPSAHRSSAGCHRRDHALCRQIHRGRCY